MESRTPSDAGSSTLPPSQDRSPAAAATTPKPPVAAEDDRLAGRQVSSASAGSADPLLAARHGSSSALLGPTAGSSDIIGENPPQPAVGQQHSGSRSSAPQPQGGARPLSRASGSDGGGSEAAADAVHDAAAQLQAEQRLAESWNAAARLHHQLASTPAASSKTAGSAGSEGHGQFGSARHRTSVESELCSGTRSSPAGTDPQPRSHSPSPTRGGPGTANGDGSTSAVRFDGPGARSAAATAAAGGAVGSPPLGVPLWLPETLVALDERDGSVNKDMVALIAGWLQERGMHASLLALRSEASLQSRDEYYFRKSLRAVALAVAEGRWDAAHAGAKNLFASTLYRGQQDAVGAGPSVAAGGSSHPGLSATSGGTSAAGGQGAASQQQPPPSGGAATGGGPAATSAGADSATTGAPQASAVPTPPLGGDAQTRGQSTSAGAGAESSTAAGGSRGGAAGGASGGAAGPTTNPAGTNAGATGGGTSAGAGTSGGSAAGGGAQQTSSAATQQIMSHLRHGGGGGGAGAPRLYDAAGADRRLAALLLEQQLLELVDAGDAARAFSLLSRRLKPLEACFSRAHFQRLLYAATCRSVAEAGAAPHCAELAGWSVEGGRGRIIDFIRRELISSHVASEGAAGDLLASDTYVTRHTQPVVPGQLHALVEHAASYQRIRAALATGSVDWGALPHTDREALRELAHPLRPPLRVSRLLLPVASQIPPLHVLARFQLDLAADGALVGTAGAVCRAAYCGASHTLLIGTAAGHLACARVDLPSLGQLSSASRGMSGESAGDDDHDHNASGGGAVDDENIHGRRGAAPPSSSRRGPASIIPLVRLKPIGQHRGAISGLAVAGGAVGGRSTSGGSAGWASTSTGVGDWADSPAAAAARAASGANSGVFISTSLDGSARVWTPASFAGVHGSYASALLRPSCDDAQSALSSASSSRAHRWGPLSACCLSPDGSVAITGDLLGTATVWQTNREPGARPGHNRHVRGGGAAVSAALPPILSDDSVGASDGPPSFEGTTTRGSEGPLSVPSIFAVTQLQEAPPPALVRAIALAPSPHGPPYAAAGGAPFGAVATVSASSAAAVVRDASELLPDSASAHSSNGRSAAMAMGSGRHARTGSAAGQQQLAPFLSGPAASGASARRGATADAAAAHIARATGTVVALHCSRHGLRALGLLRCGTVVNFSCALATPLRRFPLPAHTAGPVVVDASCLGVTSTGLHCFVGLGSTGDVRLLSLADGEWSPDVFRLAPRPAASRLAARAAVTCIALSPDDRFALVGTSTGDVQIFATSCARSAASTAHEHPVAAQAPVPGAPRVHEPLATIQVSPPGNPVADLRLTDRSPLMVPPASSAADGAPDGAQQQLLRPGATPDALTPHSPVGVVSHGSDRGGASPYTAIEVRRYVACSTAGEVVFFSSTATGYL